MTWDVCYCSYELSLIESEDLVSVWWVFVTDVKWRFFVLILFVFLFFDCFGVLIGIGDEAMRIR